MKKQLHTRTEIKEILDKLDEAQNDYLFGDGNVDSSRALITMIRCAHSGIPEAMRIFGFFLQVCFDRPSASRLSNYYIHRAAEGGDTEATMELIEQYWWKDRGTAMKWIKRARRAGMYKALHDMALNLDEEDRELTLHIFSGIPQRGAMHSLLYAEMLADTNPKKARRLARQALRKTPQDKQFRTILALCNNITPTLAAEGRAMLVRLAGKGHTLAQHKLGHCYYHGTDNFDKDLRCAFRWWKRAADNGHAPSMFELSLMYEHGEGIRRNRVKAFQYIKTAAENGLRKAITNLGYCYYWGIGTKRNFTEAVACFRHAIELGDRTIAAYNLGERYYKGQGVEKDIQKSLYFHRMAARRNYPDSICRIAYMSIHGEGVKVNVAKGVHYLHRAAKLGSAMALCELGKCYEYGIGVPQNLQKAMELYTRSAEQGYRYTKRESSRLKRKMDKLHRQS